MSAAPAHFRDKQPVGIICAIPQEIIHFDHFKQSAQRQIGKLNFRSGKMDNTPVVIVECGIGKVNAAFVSTLLCQEFGCRALIFSGIAGGLDPKLQIGDIVIADNLVQHDYGALIAQKIKTYQPGQPPLPGVDDTYGYKLNNDLLGKIKAELANIALPDLHGHKPQLHFGTVLTGDTFLNCEMTRQELQQRFSALAIEMEGGAIAQIAEQYEIPCLVVRALSDLAGSDSHLDFVKFAEEAGIASAIIVQKLLPLF
jgi:adenosylhomocysteine nucleosidase